MLLLSNVTEEPEPNDASTKPTTARSRRKDRCPRVPQPSTALKPVKLNVRASQKRRTVTQARCCFQPRR